MYVSTVENLEQLCIHRYKYRDIMILTVIVIDSAVVKILRY